MKRLLSAALAAGLLAAAPASAQQAGGQPSQTQASQHEEIVRIVQRALRRHGLYQGEVDGIVGDLTRQALQNFQSNMGLRTTGEINLATLDSLGIPVQVDVAQLPAQLTGGGPPIGQVTMLQGQVLAGNTIGSRVYDRSGDPVGIVDEVVFDQQGGGANAVIGVIPALQRQGIGKQRIVVPLDRLALARPSGRLVLDMETQELAAAPEWLGPELAETPVEGKR
ncbi:MAG: peptidoglycan-binding protein [Alphaproteobacteria bacterium]|nr:peptidoglycan-binding protein [Alphaproteobacteria bacterium]